MRTRHLASAELERRHAEDACPRRRRHQPLKEGSRAGHAVNDHQSRRNFRFESARVGDRDLRVARGGLQHALELRELERLGEKIRHPGLEAAGALLRKGRRGERNDGQVDGGAVQLEFVDQTLAIEYRHR